MKIEIDIKNYDMVDILKGDASFSALLRDKILGMDDLSWLRDGLIDQAQVAVVEYLKKQILLNMFDLYIKDGREWRVLKETAQHEISDIAKAHMYEAVKAVVAERETHTRQTVESKLNEFLRGFDPERIMVQAAKELLRESMKAADNQAGPKAYSPV